MKYVYIYICNHENNAVPVMMYGYTMLVPMNNEPTSPQQAQQGYKYNHTSCAQVHELSQSNCSDNRKKTMFL